MPRVLTVPTRVRGKQPMATEGRKEEKYRARGMFPNPTRSDVTPHNASGGGYSSFARHYRICVCLQIDRSKRQDIVHVETHPIASLMAGTV